MHIPHAENATVDIRKLRDYCLNPEHPEGKHKARLFVAALGMTEADAEPLRDALLKWSNPTMRHSDGAMPTGNAITSILHSTGMVGRLSCVAVGSSNIDRMFPASLPVIRAERGVAMNDAIHLLDVVALTADIPEYDLHRGQVGTVVDILAEGQAFEVEFSDRQGRTYESVGLRPDQLMVLHFEPASPPAKPEVEPA